MNIVCEKIGLGECKADFLAIGQFEDRGLLPIYKNLGLEINFKGTAGEYRILGKYLVVGLGKRADYNLESLRKVSAIAAKAARANDGKKLATSLQDISIKGTTARNRAQAIAEGAVLGLYQFTKYKTKKEDIKKLSKIILCCGGDLRHCEAGVTDGVIVSEAACYTRDLQNMPPNVVTPTYLAKEAEKLALKHKLKLTILGRAEMKKLGMNAILGVSAGSAEEPKLIILEKRHRGNPVAIVGKGITFDSGGLNLKPTGYIEEMKMDMSGAGTVLGTVKAVCELGLKVNLIAAVPTSENMTGSEAQRPGDIVTSHNGKTIEILNTDAEGRLILADALAYVEKTYKPKAIIDLATLTGAIVIALGFQAAGLFGNDDGLKKKLQKASEATGERVWEMPIYPEFKEWMKSDNADLQNISKAPGGRAGGSGTAAAFLENFVEGKWAHLDIAGTAIYEENREYLHKGGSGYGVRLLTEFLKGWR